MKRGQATLAQLVEHVFRKDGVLGSIPRGGSMIIFFTKMHGLGNDFLVIDNFNGRINLSEDEIVKLCDRHKGIGAGGLILIENSTNGVDCFMNYYNADGSIAEMCGDGIRCVANFLKNNYLKDKDIFEIETRAGVKKVVLEEDGMFSVLNEINGIVEREESKSTFSGEVYLSR